MEHLSLLGITWRVCIQDLRQRIRDSYEARWKAEKHFNEEEILEELPSSLRTEVCALDLPGHVLII